MSLLGDVKALASPALDVIVSFVVFFLVIGIPTVYLLHARGVPTSTK